MPIYEYRCADCGYQREYLQRMSDALLTDCPECGKRTFNKMVSAAGFQLKGGGWYATDFKNNGTKPKKESEKTAETGSKPTPGDGKASESKADAACGTGACPAS